MGWLQLRGLRCPGRHGAYPSEQQVQRVFLVDLAVRADLLRASETDALADALDFAALAGAIREIVGGPPRALLEAVAADVARTILARFPPVGVVRVRLEKPNPPGLGAAAEGVELTLRRGGREP